MTESVRATLIGKFPGVPKGAEFEITEMFEECEVNSVFQAARITAVSVHAHGAEGGLAKIGFFIESETLKEAKSEFVRDFKIISKETCLYAGMYRAKKAPKCGCRHCQNMWNASRGNV